MKTIVVATDFSEHARAAGECAIGLARRHGAELVCVHATIMGEAHPTAYEAARGKLEEFRGHLQREIGRKRDWLKKLMDEAESHGVKSQHRLVDGTPADAVCAAAEEVAADLVIVGSHGHTGLKRMLLGSVAEKVVRHCTSSVLIARTPLVAEAGFGRILVPTDFSQGAEKALDQACALAAPDAAIDLLHIWHFPGFVEGPVGRDAAYASMVEDWTADARQRGEKLVQRASSPGRTVQFHVNQGRATVGVQDFIAAKERETGDDQPYDLVAVGTHGRTGLSRFLLGSVAEVTVRYSPCSVLVARG